MTKAVKITHICSTLEHASKPEHVLGHFLPYDDHSGVEIICECGQLVFIYNGFLCELLTDEESYKGTAEEQGCRFEVVEKEVKE
jgi:hypothetical protein